MTLDELHEDELLVLIGLAKVLIRADRSTSEEEYAAVDALSQRIGGQRWGELLDAASTRFTSAEAVYRFAADIEDPDAQIFIQEQLALLAGLDALDPAEQEVLAKVAALWKIPQSE